MTTGNQYVLAEKMKDRFGRRGSSVSGMQASSTSELMRRAEREHNPNGNAAEAAFNENYRRRGTASGRTEQPVRETPRNAHRTRSAGTQSAQPRMKSADTSGAKQQRRNQHHGKKAAPAPEPQIVRPEPITPSAEERAEKKAFPRMFLAMLLIGALIFMALVSGISEVYQTKREIANLEKELAQLEENAKQLELRLEDKNDVKTIEIMASERLGMVKEEYVQKEYISLSDGERIELVDSGEEETAGGIMLSSIFSALGDFFERFK